jgi:hypothetical protein
MSSLGVWQLQMALVHCHKNITSFVLLEIQGDCKVTVKRMA